MANPRIAFLLPALEGGGAEVATLRFRSGLNARNISNSLVVMRPGGRLEQSALADGNVNQLASTSNVSAIRDYLRWLRVNRPEVSLSALDNANLVNLIASKIARVRAAVALHNTPAQDLLRNTTGKAARRVALARKLYPHADPLLACGNGVAQDACKFFGLKPDGVPVVSNPAIDPSAPATATYEFPQSGPNILSVGRLTEAKGFDVLLNAYAKAHKLTGGHLTILGEGPDRDSLAALSSSLGIGNHVSLPGFADANAAMRSCDLFVMSSRWEGLPIVLIEAVYAGCRIVSTDCPSGPDEILRSGELGYLVPVEDPEALADGVVNALKGPKPNRLPEHYAAYTVPVGTARLLEVLRIPVSDA